ncbi:hypothetical protein HMSSN036_03300 [Paenibacillus macerans]|nr:hypothetical protein HMSSN036_03300 [Paenibacillus macerans]
MSEYVSTFKGKLEGNGHTIYNLYIKATENTTNQFKYLGLIASCGGWRYYLRFNFKECEYNYQ